MVPSLTPYDRPFLQNWGRRCTAREQLRIQCCHLANVIEERCRPLAELLWPLLLSQHVRTTKRKDRDIDTRLDTSRTFCSRAAVEGREAGLQMITETSRSATC